MSYRLTNDKREAIVRAVIGGVPKEDYDTKIADRVKKLNMLFLPTKVKAVASDPELFTWLHTRYINLGRSFHSVYLPYEGIPFSEYEKKFKEDSKIKEWLKKKVEQENNIDDLRKRVKTQIGTVNTSKQLAERFPEFVKYLPQELTYTPNLPADNTLITDLVKAGWPEGKKKG